MQEEVVAEVKNSRKRCKVFHAGGIVFCLLNWNIFLRKCVGVFYFIFSFILAFVSIK